MEVTDIALSSYVQAGEMKNSMPSSNTQPSTSWCDTNQDQAMGNGSHGMSLPTTRAPAVNGRVIYDVVCVVFNPFPTLETAP